jgi:hypothetical protein
LVAPIAAVLNLETARPLARNHDLGMAIAESDLPNVTAGVVDLLGDQSSALLASRRFGLRDVSASAYPNGDGSGIEVGFEHRAKGSAVDPIASLLC